MFINNKPNMPHILLLIFSYTLSSYAAEFTIQLHELGKLGGDFNWPKRKEIIRKAVLAGIPPDSINYDRTTPLQEAVSLDSAYCGGDPEFTLFLLSHKANPNQCSSCWPHEPVITRAKKTAIFKALLAFKANVPRTSDSKFGGSLLHTCCIHERYDPELILLYAQAEIDPCTVDMYGETPLHSLMHHCNSMEAQKKAELLVHIGVPFDIKPSRGVHEDMNINEVIQKVFSCRWTIDKDKIAKLVPIITKAAQERKAMITTALSAKLTKDPVGIVLAYDGQTTKLTEPNFIYDAPKELPESDPSWRHPIWEVPLKDVYFD